MAHAVSGAEAKALRLDSSGTEIEEIEIRLLLEGIHLCYGYDFREYTLNPLRRVILRADSHLRYKDVRAIFNRVQEVGFPGVALMVGERHRAPEQEPKRPEEQKS